MRFTPSSILNGIGAVAIQICCLSASDAEMPGRRPAGALGSTQTSHPALEASLVIGYAKTGSVPCDAWAPVHLFLTNNTDVLLDGKWRLRIKDRRESTYTVDYAMPVQLAGHGTQKHFVMHVYLPPGRSIYGYYDAEPEAWVETPRGVPILARRALALNAVSSHVAQPAKGKDGEEEIVVFRDLYLWLGAGGPPPLEHRPVPQQQRVFIAGQPEYLPRRWCGYAGFTAVIWDGGDLTRWEEAARQALCDYVAAGGHLVVAVGSNGNILRNSFLAPLLPAMIEAEDEQEADKIFGSQALPGCRLAFSRLVPAKDSLVLQGSGSALPIWQWSPSSGDAPLAVRGDYGAGTVTVLAISLQTTLAYQMAKQRDAAAAAAWNNFGERVLHRPCETLLAQRNARLRPLAHNSLLAAASKPIPSRYHILAFLAVYILVSVPLFYLLARGFGRPEAAWLFLPLAALLFFGINYLYAFQHLKKDLTMTDLNLIRLGSGHRRESGGGTTFSLAHNPTYRAYRVDFGLPQITPLYLRLARLPSLADETLDFNLCLYEQNSRIWLEDFMVPFNEERPLETMHVLPVGQGLTLRLSPAFVEKGDPGVGGVVGEADNGLDIPLFHLALLHGDRGWLLQPIPAKTAASVHVASHVSLPTDAIIANLCEAAGRKQLAALLPLAVASLAEGEQRWALVAVLPRQTLLPWQVAGHAAEATGTTVICCLLPYYTERPLRILGERLERNTLEER